jgi:hypothetical protein
MALRFSEFLEGVPEGMSRENPDRESGFSAPDKMG